MSETRGDLFSRGAPLDGADEAWETGESGPAPSGRRRCAVLLPYPFDTPFDYEVPEGLEVGLGDLVEVPLGPRRVIGVVWGPASGDVDEAKVKALVGALPVPSLPDPLRTFLDWVAAYTLTPPGLVLALALRARGLADPPKMEIWVRGGGPAPERLTPARRRVIEVAGDGLARRPKGLAEEAGVGSSVVKGLIAAGTLIEESRPADAPFRAPVPGPPNPHLTPTQAAAADVLRGAVRAGAGPPILLDGVTGSGKTETYFEAVAEAIEAGRQVLVLLPEIALTAQTLDRFAERFGERPAEWHSGLSQPERRRVWLGVAEGQAQVVVGARSALFLPFADLGLIIVDEEHDQSYKQEDGVVYHARDMAVVRARLEGCPVVLASATPSLETMINAEQGRYRHVVLPTRYGPARMPEVQPSDLRQAGMDASHWIGPGVSAGIGQALDRGEQALLFLNRRGYSPLVLCRACGHRLMSPNASSWLVEHRYTGRLVCHLTGYSRPKPTRCPECGTEGSLVSCGPGVERIAEEAAALFPQARLAVMSSDMLHTRTDAADLVTRMAAGEIDILVATQMAAKGHNFPGLTFVGIIDADMSLRGGDLRAGERTFQLLHQVAGRAGRADRPGSVLLQTYAPDHPVIAALCSGDRAGFYDREAFEREAMGMPPFGRLAAVILSGRDGAATQDFARGLRALAPVAEGLSIYGPAPAAHAIVRGQHRYRLLLKAAPEKSVQTYLRQWLGPVRVPSGLRLSIDVDPYSFL